VRAACHLTATTDQTRLGLMKVINIQAAKTHLSRLVEEAARGEEIVIAKAGRPYVKLVSCLPAATARTLGGWEGKVEIAADFDEPSREIEALFEGRIAAARSGASRKRPGSKSGRKGTA
jgi:prevent-host-death family protein